jgi:hypothetical protein
VLAGDRHAVSAAWNNHWWHPHYWIAGLNGPVSLVACHLAGEFGYQGKGAVTAVFATTEPFPVRLRLGPISLSNHRWARLTCSGRRTYSAGRDLVDPDEWLYPPIGVCGPP